MGLSKLVELYRITGKPAVNDEAFSASIPWSTDVVAALDAVRNDDRCLDELLVDGTEYFPSDRLPSNGFTIAFECKLPQQSSSRFYQSIENLVDESPDISKGVLPDEFYLISENYYSAEDSSKPTKLSTLESIVDLINGLSHLAHYHDQKSMTANSKRLVFIHPDHDKNLQPAVLETKIIREVLFIPPLDTQLIKSLTADSISNNPHYNAEVGILSNTIVDFVSVKSDSHAAFVHLVKNWDSFLMLYHKNLSTYLSGFAFHKAKKEVAEAQLDLAERFSNIIGSITGRLLSIPLSFAGVFAIFKSESGIERFIFLLGLFLASYVIFKAIENQERQLIGVSHSKKIIFDALDGRIETFPDELISEIEQMKGNLDDSEKKLKDNLAKFYKLCWAPAIIGAIAFVATSTDILLNLWQKFATWLFTC